MGDYLDLIYHQYQSFFEQLTDESVEEFREFASTNVRYRDPFVDARNVDDAVAYLHKTFKDLDDIRFVMKGHARNGYVFYQYSQMIFRLKRLPQKLWKLDMMSKIIFNDEGKLIDHSDYWDASPLFESFPLLGKSITLIKKLT